MLRGSYWLQGCSGVEELLLASAGFARLLFSFRVWSSGLHAKVASVPEAVCHM